MQSEEAAASPAAPIEADAAVTTTGVDALSSTSRLLTRIVAVLFALMGLVLFVAPDWASQNFLWKVPPFAIMTMGGWYIGAAIGTWEVARVWRWPVVYPAVLFLWSFSLLEAGVLLVHMDLLRPEAAFGWPYLVVIVVAALSALYGIYDWTRLRPRAASGGKAISSQLRLAIIIFTVAVFLIAVFPILGYGKNRSVFPEPLTVFTLQAFGVFYLSIVIGVLPLLWEKSILPALFYSRTGLALIYVITLAAIFNLDKFNFSEHPGGLLYWGAYVSVGIIATIMVVQNWSYSQEAERTA